MEFLIGVLTALVIVLLYDKFNPRNKDSVQRTEEEITKEQEIQAHFTNMLNYDVDQAYRGGKR